MPDRYEIRADVEGTGPVKHLTRAADPEEAKQRLRSAYPDRKLGALTVALRKTDNN